MRVFPAAAGVRIEMRLKPAQINARLEIELCDAAGRRPLRVAFAEDGRVQAADGDSVVGVGTYAAGEWVTLCLTADLAAGACAVQVNGGASKRLAVAAKGVRNMERLSLRTGAWRGCGDSSGVEAKTDVPMAKPAVFHLDGVTLCPLR